MRKVLFVCTVSLLVSSFTFASGVRSFVSGSGVDNASCDRTTPCRNFAAAITATDTGGEVVALDSAGYGPVTITKSISIIVPLGIHAAIAPTSGNGITINAPGGTVVLKNLFINSQGGSSGITVSSADTVVIEKCEMANFINQNLITSSVANLLVRESVFRGGGTHNAVVNGGISSFDHCRFEKSGSTALLVQGSSPKAFVSNSVVVANGGHGVASNSSTSQVSVKSCVLSGNSSSGAGSFFSGAILRVSASMIVNNGQFGLLNTAGTILKYNNNEIRGNASGETSGSITGSPLD